MCPPISHSLKEGTNVTWNAPGGTFYQGGTWADYAPDRVCATTPTDQTVYWRSNPEGAIDATYTVTATFTPATGTHDITLPAKELKSRSLNPDNADHRDKFCEDVDMLQRAVIQIFGLDKGSLDQYERGLYRKNGYPDIHDNTSDQRYYHSSRPRAYPKWSKIADEVENIDRWVLRTDNYSNVIGQRHIKAIWGELGLIFDAGTMGEIVISLANPDHVRWLREASARVNLDNVNEVKGCKITGQQLLIAISRAEGDRRHSFPLWVPYSISNVSIGEQKTGTGDKTHSLTDWGIGACKIQPFNRFKKENNVADFNVYKPDENLYCSAALLKKWCGQVPKQYTGPYTRLWRAAHRYKQGDWGGIGAPSTLTGNGATYANKVFGFLALAVPTDNSQ